MIQHPGGIEDAVVTVDLSEQQKPAEPALGPAPSLRGPILRLLMLLGVAIMFWFVMTATPWGQAMSVERLRQMAVEGGMIGIGGFLLACTLRDAVQFPPALLVAIAVLAYGGLVGCLVGYVGLCISNAVGFCVVRRLGGQALDRIEKPWVRRWLDRLDERPVLCVLLLRQLFFMMTAVNTTLALTGVRFRHYMLGSAIGLIAPCIASACLSDLIIDLLQVSG